MSATRRSTRCMNAFLHHLDVYVSSTKHSNTTSIARHVIKLLNSTFEHHRSAFERNVVDVFQRWSEVTRISVTFAFACVIFDCLVVVDSPWTLSIISQTHSKVRNWNKNHNNLPVLDEEWVLNVQHSRSVVETKLTMCLEVLRKRTRNEIGFIEFKAGTWRR